MSCQTSQGLTLSQFTTETTSKDLDRLSGLSIQDGAGSDSRLGLASSIGGSISESIGGTCFRMEAKGRLSFRSSPGTFRTPEGRGVQFKDSHMPFSLMGSLYLDLGLHPKLRWLLGLSLSANWKLTDLLEKPQWTVIPEARLEYWLTDSLAVFQGIHLELLSPESLSGSAWAVFDKRPYFGFNLGFIY